MSEWGADTDGPPPKTRNQIQHAYGNAAGVAFDSFELLKDPKYRSLHKALLTAYYIGKADGLQWVLEGVGHSFSAERETKLMAVLPEVS